MDIVSTIYILELFNSIWRGHAIRELSMKIYAIVSITIAEEGRKMGKEK